MDACCGWVILFVIVYIIIQIMTAASKASGEKNERMNVPQNTQENTLNGYMDNKNKLKSEFASIKWQEEYVINDIKSFFAKREDGYTLSSLSYACVYEGIMCSIDRMNNLVASMKKTVSSMSSFRISYHEDQSKRISQDETCIREALEIISRVQHLADGLKVFEENIYMLPSSKMMDEKNYGKINKKYWDYICNGERENVVSFVTNCEELLNSTQFDEIYKLNIDIILECVWFFATEKTFSTSDFQRAESVFSRIYKCSHADVIIADLYAKKKMGGEDVLRDPVHNLLKVEHDSRKLTLIASGLMWMNAYQSENTILQHMLTTGKEMTAKTQERLHSLTNGGGKSPSGFDVKSSNDSLYFDVSALAWKDDEYIGLFENLVFQDKALTYSLALRDENKDLFVAQGLNVPGREDILRKFKSIFAEEYGSNVTVQEVDCIALSGSGEEKMDGIMVCSNECKQMGILIHIARIGKKLIIKFYTLFMPTDADLVVQKQQALSMYKKLSPSVTMWESSLKDTMLMAVEQLLNAGVTSGTTGNDNIPESVMADFDEPIF